MITKFKIFENLSNVENLKDLIMQKADKSYLAKSATFFINFDLSTDTLIKAKYEEVKRHINEICNKMTPSIIDKYARETGAKTIYDFIKDSELLRNFSWEYITDNILFVKGKLKKLYKLKPSNELEKKIVDETIKQYEMVLPIAEKLEKMKEKIVKKESASEIKIKKYEEIKGKIDQDLLKAIETVAENFRLKIEQSLKNTYTFYLKDYKEKGFEWLKEMDGSVRNFIYLLKNTKLSEEDFVNQKAIEHSNEIIQEFIYKMIDKLGGLIKISTVGVDIDYSGTKNYNYIKFKFSDGNEFTVQNDIVWGHSKYGVEFHRYPTTFHNIKIGDNFYKSLSEFEVKKEFENFYK